MVMKIGVFARRGRVSVKALRHYDAIGLLKPAHVDPATGYRSYQPRQLDDLHRLMVYRALGFPLERIRALQEAEPSAQQMRALLDERKATLARRIEAERAQFALLEARIRHLEGTARGATHDVVVRDLPATFVAGLRRVVPEYDAVDDLFAEIKRALPSTARVAGWGAVWHHCAPAKREIDCEALVLLERPAQPLKALKVYQLPACRAACVVYPSDEDAFSSACAAVRGQPFEFSGPIRERYYSSAGDKRFDLTEVQFPLRGVQP